MNRVLPLLISIAIAGCTTGPASPSDVRGPTWKLVSWQEAGSPAQPVENPSRYTIRFGDDQRLSILSDCNSCSGPCSLTGATLDVGPLGCTRAFCGEGSLDRRYTSAIERAQSVSRDGGMLTTSAPG